MDHEQGDPPRSGGGPEDAFAPTTTQLTTSSSFAFSNKNYFNLEKLPIKLQKEILNCLDFHTLLKCRLVSKSFKALVESMAAESSKLEVDRNLTWNPYYTVRRYFDVDAHKVLGLVRLENAAAVKKFVEENSKQTGSTKENKPALGRKMSTPPYSSRTPSRASSNTSSKRSVTPPSRPPFRPAGAPPKKLPSKPLVKSPSIKSTSSAPKVASQSSLVFPLGSVHIRRRLQDYVDAEKRDSAPPADTNKEIIMWSNRLVQNFGSQITSFTFDDGKRKGSDLSFSQLAHFFKHLPNLVFLGVSSGNYEHYSFDENTGEHGEVERFPPLPNLKYVWLGYNTTYHLHMDILNAYGNQLKRLVNSKFGIFLTLA